MTRAAKPHAPEPPAHEPVAPASAFDPLLPAAGTRTPRIRAQGEPRWWELQLLWLATPRAQRLYRWLAPALVTLLAAVLRLAGLGQPHALVFDETYYVKDAWSLLHNGFESTWPDDANARFVAGETDIFSTTGSFVVHPPLGKWLIGLGMLAFGADSSWGWRISTAVFGILAVLVVFFIGKALTGSTTVGALAGFLLAIDGLGIVMSRVSLLDNILMFFIVLAFWFVLLDRRRMRDRLLDAVAARVDGGASPAWGPVLWNRPWILAAGAALGAACAVKWSGVYVLAGLGVYLVVTDALARRRAGIAFWPTDAVLRQGVATFLLLVPIAFAVYLASWTGWLVTDGGYGRHGADADPATGFWSWVPLPLQSLWKYHEAIYGFHVGLSSPHPYASPAWQWPLLKRPTWMYWNLTPQGQDGCTSAGGCGESISSTPNPLIWFAGVAAVLYLVYRLIRHRDWQSGFVLTGVVVTYVPWLIYPERTIFQFYTIAILPFMVLAIAIAARDIARAGVIGRLAPGRGGAAVTARGGDDDDDQGDDDGGAAGTDAAAERRASGRWVVLIFLVFAVLVSAYFYPVWAGWGVPYDFWRLHNWSPTWV